MIYYVEKSPSLVAQDCVIPLSHTQLSGAACGVCSGQTDGAGIVLSLESKEVDVLAAARELLLENLPPGVTVLGEELDSRRHSNRASMETQR